MTGLAGRTAALVAEAEKKARRKYDNGGLGDTICKGCVLCDTPGVVAHYPPRSRAQGFIRVAYIDADGVIYDRYYRSGDWDCIHPTEELKLKRETVLVVRAPRS